jgi:hypothetical protein
VEFDRKPPEIYGRPFDVEYSVVADIIHNATSPGMNIMAVEVHNADHVNQDLKYGGSLIVIERERCWVVGGKWGGGDAAAAFLVVFMPVNNRALVTASPHPTKTTHTVIPSSPHSFTPSPASAFFPLAASPLSLIRLTQV